MNLVRNYSQQLVSETRATALYLWHSRSAQLVILLFLLPWLGTFSLRRDLNLFSALVPILGIVVVYWFLTRPGTAESLPVRRPLLEAMLALVFVAVWIAYRLAEYARLLSVPALTLSACADMTDTIAPKMLEMFFVPLVLFVLLRYSPARQGLGLSLRAWLPALLPLAYYVLLGLGHQKPDGLLTRTFCFYLGAALPEEYLFRGLVQSRLEALTRRPAWGLLLASFVFGLSHIPINVHGTGVQNLQGAFETAFTFQMAVGLALGYAFQRTRNLWPLTLIHALIDSAPLALACARF